MPIQLAMVGLVVGDMKRSLAFYRRLGLDIPLEEDEKRFVMHRMPSGVTIFFDSVFFPAEDPERRPAPRGSYNISLEFYAGTREAVDRLYDELVGLGYAGRRAPWKSSGPYAALVEDPDGNPILITAEDARAEI
jgi:catechol 2,3-dioxygenase-like lactoylglutathione lyase family enzyme